MSIISKKITTFTFNHKDQIDELYLTYPNSLDIKKAFDSRCEDIQTKYNGLIDYLLQTTASDSGANNIGVTSIPGISGNDIQTVLESLKTAIDNASTGSIPDGSLDGVKLKESTITYNKIGNGQVKRVNLEDYVINRQKIADGEVTQIKIQNYIGAGTGISTAKVENKAITEPKLADSSVSERTIQSNSVNQAALQTASVGTAQLINDSITEAKFQNLSVSTRVLQDFSVTASKLDPNAIDLVNINRERANVNGYLDSLSLAIPSNTVYDYFEGTNDFSLAKIDNFFTNTSAAYNIGIDTVSVISTTGLVAGMEVTIQGEDLVTTGLINKEDMMILSVLSPTSLQFTTGLTKSYKTQAMVYRSFYAPRTETTSGLQFPEYRRTGTGWGTKSTNPGGTIGYCDSIHFSPSGKWIVTGCQTYPYYQVIPFNQSTGVLGTPIVQTNPTAYLSGACEGVQFSLDSTFVMLGHVNSAYLDIRTFDDVTGQVGPIPDLPLILPPGQVNKFSINNTGDFLGLCGDGGTASNRSIAIYSFEKVLGENPSKFNDSSGTATYTATSTKAIFTENNKYLIVSYSGNPALNSFRIDTVARTIVGRVSLKTPFNNCNGRGCALTSDNKYVAVAYFKNPSGSDNFAVYRFNSETGQIGAALTIPSYPSGDGKGIKFSYDDKMLTVLHSNSPFITTYRFNEETETFTLLGSPGTTLLTGSLDIDYSPNHNYVGVASLGTDNLGVWAFESTKVNLLNDVDIRYNLTDGTVSKLRIFAIYEKDATFSLTAEASIETTTTENFLPMTRTIVSVDATYDEAQFVFTPTTPGQYVHFKLLPHRSSTSVIKNFVKLLGYVE